MVKMKRRIRVVVPRWTQRAVKSKEEVNMCVLGKCEQRCWPTVKVNSLLGPHKRGLWHISCCFSLPVDHIQWALFCGASRKRASGWHMVQCVHHCVHSHVGWLNNTFYTDFQLWYQKKRKALLSAYCKLCNFAGAVEVAGWCWWKVIHPTQLLTETCCNLKVDRAIWLARTICSCSFSAVVIYIYIYILFCSENNPVEKPSINVNIVKEERSQNTFQYTQRMNEALFS